MRTPSEIEINQLMHLYDPKYAHEYYLRTRKLKGRKKGSAEAASSFKSTTAKPGAAKEKQRKELALRIQSLSNKLSKLEALIRQKEHEDASKDRKSVAKKNAAAKEKDKPKSAAEKAKINRENKKYRDKHKQELKSKAKAKGSGGGSSSGTTKSSSSSPSVSDLRSLATRVRGQIETAKQKLAAL